MLKSGLTQYSTRAFYLARFPGAHAKRPDTRAVNHHSRVNHKDTPDSGYRAFYKRV